VKTNFRPTTTTTTPVPPTRVSARIQARVDAAAADDEVDESLLSNEEGLDVAKEANESAFLLQQKCRHVKTNFRPTTTTTTVAVGSQPKGYSTKSMTASIEESRLSIEGAGVAKEARGSALLVCRAV